MSSSITSWMNIMLMGAHVSASGGYFRGIERGMELGCESIQIFPSAPHSWATKPILQEEITTFSNTFTSSDIASVYFHAIYLLNLATEDATHLKKSTLAMIEFLNLSEQIGVNSVVLHPGNHKGIGQEAGQKILEKSLINILDNSPDTTKISIENMSGAGTQMCGDFEQIISIIENIGSDRVGICLDTQHAFAYGYDIRRYRTCHQIISLIESRIGLDKLHLIHANDSKTALGSNLDRHENIGEGHIGNIGLKNMMHCLLQTNIPFILEVPGYSKKGPDNQSISDLKSLHNEIIGGYIS